MSRARGRGVLCGRGVRIGTPGTRLHLRFWPANWWRVSSGVLRSGSEPSSSSSLLSVSKYDSSSAPWRRSSNGWLKLCACLCVSGQCEHEHGWGSAREDLLGCGRLVLFWGPGRGVHLPAQGEVL